MPTQDKGKKAKKKGGKADPAQSAEIEGECSTSQDQAEQQEIFRDNLNNENIEEYLPNYQAEWFSMVIKNQVKRHIPDHLKQQQTDLENVIDKKFESMQREFHKWTIDIEVKLKTAFNLELAEVKKRLNEMEEDSAKKQRRIERLEYTINQKDVKINKLKTTIDDLEQKHYMREVQIVGIPESSSDEEDAKKVLNLAKSKMGQKLKKSDVEGIHRLGKKSEKKTRDVIIKFKEQNVRDAFYLNRKKLIIKNDAKNSIYINDHLTHHRQSLLYAARQLYKAKKVSAAWSQNGNVLVRKSENDSAKQITNHDDLNEYNRKFDDSRYDEDTALTAGSTDGSEGTISHLSDYSY